MAFSLQKANMYKRISAWLFDAVMCLVLATGMLVVMSALLKYDVQAEKLNGIYEDYYARYEAEHEGVELNPSDEVFNAFTQEELETYRQHYDEVNKQIAQDEEAQRLQVVIINYTFLMITVSLLTVSLVWHFLIPLIIGDGRTLGKKIFGLAVMRTNGLKLSNPILFVRSILGLFTMETMVPVFFALMIYFGFLGLVGIVATVLLFILEIVVMATTKTNASIHCLLSDTVVVDFASQQIFQTQEALEEFMEKERLAELQKRENQ